MFKKMFQAIGKALPSGFPGSESLFAFFIGVLAIAGPIIIIPWGGLTVSAAKSLLVTVIAMVMVVIAAVSALKHGRIVMPRHPAFLIWIGLCAAGLLGSILSGGFRYAMVGYLFEPTSWIFLAEFGIIAWYSYRVMRTPARMAAVYGGAAAAFGIAAIIAIIRFAVGGAFLNLGVLWNTTATIAGSWPDFAALAGFVVIAAVLTLEVAPIKRGFKWAVATVGIAAAALLFFMNIRSVWTVVGLSSLISALYLFSFASWDPDSEQYRKERRVPWFALGLAVLAILGMFFGTFANAWASRHQAIVWNDARPNISMTIRAGVDAILHNPITGYGPNGFGAAWSHAKPPALSSGNPTDYRFSSGYGFVPSSMASMGVLGVVAWLAWFVMIIAALVRSVVRSFATNAERYASLLVGATTLYLGMLAWTMNLGVIPLVLFAIIVGILLGGSDTPRSLSFIKDPRTSFFGIIGVLVVAAAAMWGLVVVVRNTTATVWFNQGSRMVSEGNANGIARMTRASLVSGFDQFHRQNAFLILGNAGKALSQSNPADKNALSKQVEQLVGTALGHAQAAVEYNPHDYQNYVALGDIYRTMAGWGIEGAGDRARAAYDDAVKRNPSDAGLLLSYAQLAIAEKNTPQALDYVSQSIDRYPTRNAYLIRAQIKWGAGNYDDALAAVAAAVAIDNRNPDLTYQYGQLLFARSKYAGAIQAFIRTIAIAPNYGPAYAYLGVSYERSGDQANANRVYDYLRKQSGDAADRLITQIKNQSAAVTPAPIDETKTAAPDAKKPVAPTKKKQ